MERTGGEAGNSVLGEDAEHKTVGTLPDLVEHRNNTSSSSADVPSSDERSHTVTSLLTSHISFSMGMADSSNIAIVSNLSSEVKLKAEVSDLHNAFRMTTASFSLQVLFE